MNILNWIKSRVTPTKEKKEYTLSMNLSCGKIEFIESNELDNVGEIHTSAPIFPKYDNSYLIDLNDRITEEIPGIDFISYHERHSIGIKKARFSSWETIVEPLLLFIDKELSQHLDKLEQKENLRQFPPSSCS
jgi:hypothetical protein